MTKQAHNFNPDYAVPPGATLLETIQHIGFTQKELAERMGRPLKTINEIIKGVASITAETSIQLEKVTGISAQFWNNAESNYRERLARIQEKKGLEKQIKWLKRFSYNKMVQLDMIKSTKDNVDRVDNLLRFFGVAKLSQWESTYSRLEGAARESNKGRSELGDLSVWLRAGEILAQKINCDNFSEKKFKENLFEIRKLTDLNPSDTWDKVKDLCAEAGVALVLVPELPKTRVYGFTRWLTPQKALIQLSLRYKTDDMLWFTFFHEAAHILLHGKKDVFMEFRGVDDSKEEEANKWASDFMIPPSEWNEFLKTLSGYPNSNTIKSFSKKIGIATGVVVGRLQHQEALLPPSRLNTLKHKIKISWPGLQS